MRITSEKTPIITIITDEKILDINLQKITNILNFCLLRVHLYKSECESESDVASDLLHCFQSVCLL